MIPAASTPWAHAEELGASVPELAAFQDEPLQMKSGTVGKTGFLRLGLEHRANQTILANLERRAPYMVQRALYCDPEMPSLACVFLITTTGCLLQGDRLALDITLGPRAEAHVTTQSATKIHAMDANYAAQTQSIALADDAYLEFLPDPVIPHRQARFVSDTQIFVAPSATLLFSEIIQPGRKHHRPDECFAPCREAAGARSRYAEPQSCQCAYLLPNRAPCRRLPALTHGGSSHGTRNRIP
jgi:urease accessory protein